MARRLAHCTILAGIVVGIAIMATLRPAHAQGDQPVRCQVVFEGLRETLSYPIQSCEYPDGTQTLKLEGPDGSASALLMLNPWGGLPLWAPVAPRIVPDTFAALPGDLFSVEHPTQPPCTFNEPIGPTEWYVYVLGQGRELWAAATGAGWCMR